MVYLKIHLVWRSQSCHHYLIYLRLHFLPLLQVEAVLVGLLVAVELLQLLCQGGSTFTGLLLQTMVLLDLGGERNSGSYKAIYILRSI